MRTPVCLCLPRKVILYLVWIFSLNGRISCPSLPQYLSSVYLLHFLYYLPSLAVTFLVHSLVKAHHRKEEAVKCDVQSRIKFPASMIRFIVLDGRQTDIKSYYCTFAMFLSVFFQVLSVSVSAILTSDRSRYYGYLNFNYSRRNGQNVNTRHRPLILQYPSY